MNGMLLAYSNIGDDDLASLRAAGLRSFLRELSISTAAARVGIVAGDWMRGHILERQNLSRQIKACPLF